MKKITLSIISLLMILISSAQITILSTDLMDVGDSVQLANVETIPAGFGPGSAGPNQHWDFSSLEKDTVLSLNFVNPGATPYGSSFPFSNVAVEGLVVSGYGVEGWAYGTKTTSLFQIDGAGGSYEMFEDVIVPFNPPEVMFDFPVNYEDSLQQTSTIDIRLDSPEPAVDSIRVKVVTSVDSRVDAWGEVMTPTWTGDVLRFRDVRTTIDSAWAKVVFFWVFIETNTNVSVTYKYMANNVGYPVLQFNANADETEFSGLNFMLDAGVGEQELFAHNEIEINIFPNPASDVMYCRVQHVEVEGEIVIYDMHGRQLKTLPVTSNQQQYKIDVSAFPAGLYQLVLKADGKGVSAKKFVVR